MSDDDLPFEEPRYDGVYFADGGSLTNGAATDTAASISGYTGVAVMGASTDLTNFGTIAGTGVATSRSGVYLQDGGVVANGVAGKAAATISGATGVHLGAEGTVINYGQITGATGAGVSIAGLGRVFNGLMGQISGEEGVYLAGGGAVSNNGTILGEANTGPTGAGVFLTEGGVVNNGAASDRSALIAGDYGVFSRNAAATVNNLGTINGDYHSAGVEFYAGGALFNGSTKNSAALISGYDGVKLLGVASVANFGTIAGVGGYGVYLLGAGESVTNGAQGRAGALIEGYTGIEVYASGATVTNFGAIDGQGGAAVTFQTAGDTLIVEAGSSFAGAVLGAGGTLDLASGTGTLSGLAGGAVTVSGSMASTTFQAFNTMEVGAGATFIDTGAVTLTASQTIDAAGILNLGGGGTASIANAGLIETTGGTLTVNGAVTGAGHAAIAGGTLDLTSSFTQNVTFTGSGVLELAQSQGYTGTITGLSKTSSTSLDLVDIGFVSSAEATYSGTKTGGVLTVTDGTHTAHIALKGNYLASTFVASSDGHGGTSVVDPTKAAGAPGRPPTGSTHPLVAAMAAMAGDPAISIGPAHEGRGAGPPLLCGPRSFLA